MRDEKKQNKTKFERDICMDPFYIQSLSYVPIKEGSKVDGLLKLKKQNELKGKLVTSKEDFSWTLKANTEETYVTIVNQSSKPIKKGDQVWLTYGEEPNKFLLTNYGFCYKNNVHDSLNFDVKIGAGQSKEIGDILYFSKKSDPSKTQEIVLKKLLLNETLMAYLRNELKPEKSDIPITRPSSLDLEFQCLQKYQ